MKSLIAILILGMMSQAMASDKILECEAKGTDKGKVLFEIQATISDAKVYSQGTALIDSTGRKQKLTSLTLTSQDKFEDDFSIIILVKDGNKVIESAALSNLSLKSGLNSYGISKDLGDYKFDLICNRIN